MPISFGSVGDIIAICLLVKDLVAALDESKGSAAEYQEVRLELRALERALLEVEVLSRSHASTAKLNALYATARKAALDCRQPVEAFLDRIKKYDPSLGAGASRNIVRNTAMKIRWQISQKDEVNRFRAEICAYSSSINMLLATVNVNLAQANHTDVSKQLSDSSNRQTILLQDIRDRLEENNTLVSANTTVAMKFKEALRLDWFTKFGAEVKDFMVRIMNINIATYNTVLSIQAVISGGLQRSLTHEPFILEDAIGRISPVHLQFINSWEAFDAVLELRFQKIQGYGKVQRREYILQEHATKREISRSRQWEGAFLPGQKIDMSLIFASKSRSGMGTSCPSCKEVSKSSQDYEIQCDNCGIWYRRITEQFDEEQAPTPESLVSKQKPRKAAQFGMPSFTEITFGPKPPSQFQALPSSHKRRLECTELEEDDLSQFKRVRLVSKEKRKRPDPFSGFPIGNYGFDAGQQQKREEQTAWDELRALQASLGNTHADTLAHLNAFTRSLRNWGKYQTAEMIISDALKSGESEMLAQRPEVLQLMLSGLMTVLIDQSKLSEAEILWETSIETFRTKVGEESANMLENHFQRAHPFRAASASPQGMILDTIDSHVTDLSPMTPKMSAFVPAQGFRRHWDPAGPNPEHRDRGWTGPDEISRGSKETSLVYSEVEEYVETSRESSIPSPSLHPTRVAGSQKGVKTSFLANNEHLTWSSSSSSEDECMGTSPSIAASQATKSLMKRGRTGGLTLLDFIMLRTLDTCPSAAGVYLARLKHNKRPYSIKVISKGVMVDTSQVGHTHDERKILRSIARDAHPFIATLLGTLQDSQNVYIITDFVEGSHLFSLLGKSERFPESVTKFYAAELILAIEYLHGNKIAYRDITPNNILVDYRGHLKLRNFTFAKRFKTTTSTICGSPEYMAPELVLGSEYTHSVDWWALGILIYEMLYRFTPFWVDDVGDPYTRTYENILRSDLVYPAYIHPNARDLLSGLLTLESSKRLGSSSAGAQDIKRHAWFANTDWEKLLRKEIDAPLIPPVKSGDGDASLNEKLAEESDEFGDDGDDGYGDLFKGF